MHLLLVDDDPLLLAALQTCLELERPEWTVLTASNGIEALKRLRAERVDLLVTDIQMPSLDGMALLGEIRSDSRLSRLPLILITGRDDRSTMREGMASGADDFLTKPFLAQELIQAIEGRMRRLSPPNPSPECEAPDLGKLLTEREREVLTLIGQGLVTKQIARGLGVSPNTVSVHRANIMRKLDLHNAAALAALAVRLNLT